MPWLVFKTFGTLPLLGYLLVYLNNPLADFGWTAGSYFRSLWFVSLVAAVCALAARRHGLAGLCMAFAAACRLFPAMFGIACLLVLAAGVRERPGAPARFVVVGALTASTVIAAALGLFGLEPWTEFQTMLAERIDPYGNNSIGLLKVGSFYNVVAWPGFAGGADALNAMQDYLRVVRFDELQTLGATWFIRMTMVLVAIAVAMRLPPVAGVVCLGTVLVFVWLAPFRYYFVFLALLPPAIALIERPRGACLAVVFGMVLLLRVASVPFQSAFGNDPGYFNVSFHASVILALGLCLLLAGLCWSAFAGQPRTHGGRAPASALLVLLPLAALAALAAGATAYRLAPARTAGYHEFQAFEDRRAGAGVTLAVRPATASWGGSDYLEIEYPAPGRSVVFTGLQAAACECEITLWFTSRSDDADFVVDLDGRTTTIRQIRAGDEIARRVAVPLGRHALTAATRVTLRPLPVRPSGAGRMRIGVDGLLLDGSQRAPSDPAR